jgi:hypothetical protein
MTDPDFVVLAGYKEFFLMPKTERAREFAYEASHLDPDDELDEFIIQADDMGLLVDEIESLGMTLEYT